METVDQTINQLMKKIIHEPGSNVTIKSYNGLSVVWEKTFRFINKKFVIVHNEWHKYGTLDYCSKTKFKENLREAFNEAIPKGVCY